MGRQSGLRLNARFSWSRLRPNLQLMSFIAPYLTAQRWPLLAAVLSALILGGAYVFEYGFGYAPCPLCLDQRYIHMAAIAAGLIGFLALRLEAVKPFAMWVCLIIGAIFLYSAGFAGWHAGIEYGWWEGPASCSTAGPLSISADDLFAVMDGTATGVVPCGVAAWTLFGISMAGYNALMSFGLAMISFYLGVFRK
ncbi:disulfide bond formation protein B [Hyphobacterium sp.]|uniref:disulfide bond formation protein B n=1 Tax=Hyphobacterium sp. TaxID=2004662 RepID=UPI003BADB191